MICSKCGKITNTSNHLCMCDDCYKEVKLKNLVKEAVRETMDDFNLKIIIKEELQEIVRQAIQKYIDHGTVETRACADCKYYDRDPNEEPCRCCCYGDGLDNWEARDEDDGRNT